VKDSFKKGAPGHPASTGYLRKCFLAFTLQALRSSCSHGLRGPGYGLSWWQTLPFLDMQDLRITVMEASTQISKEGVGDHTMCNRVGACQGKLQ
jgi:hypothetical protein